MEEKAKPRGPYTVENVEHGDSMAVRTGQILRGHGEVLSGASTKGHVCIHGPAAAGVRVYVCDPSYYQRPRGCLWFGLLPKTMWISEGHAACRGTC